MISIRSNQFFKRVALNSGVSDLGMVKNIYYGIVRTMGQELKARHVITLPDWGKFMLKIKKSRMVKGVRDKKEYMLPAQPMVKFVPATKVKKHFHMLANESTMLK
jgi:nucleoid DNA-binding protein